MVDTATPWLSTERRLEVLWVSGHCGLMCAELTDERTKIGASGPLAYRRIRFCHPPSQDTTCMYLDVRLHGAACTQSPHREDAQVSKCRMIDLRCLRLSKKQLILSDGNTRKFHTIIDGFASLLLTRSAGSWIFRCHLKNPHAH